MTHISTTPRTDALVAEFPGVPQARLRAMNIQLTDLCRELEGALHPLLIAAMDTVATGVPAGHLDGAINKAAAALGVILYSQVSDPKSFHPKGG